MTMLRKKLFGDTKEFAALAKFFALLKVLLMELPNQRFPLVVAQLDESTNREMKESFGKNVLKHNVSTSEVSYLLDGLFPDVIKGFDFSNHEGRCHISLMPGILSIPEIRRFEQREKKLIADFDGLQLRKEELDQTMEVVRRR